MKSCTRVGASLLWLGLAACAPAPVETEPAEESLLSAYTEVTLTTDVSLLSEWERRMIPHLVAAAEAMEESYWLQAYGDRDELLATMDDPELAAFAAINYGPWDRLRDNEPFVPGVGPKPPGANFYPADITKKELEYAAEEEPELAGLYTMVRRDEQGALEAIPYSDFFSEHFERAAAELEQAAELAEDPELREYLHLRAEALRTNDYLASDMAWMDMKENRLDLVIGPIETYEDQLSGLKAANEALVLVKDLEWSQRLSRYARLLPELQRALPVEDDYKRETPGLEAELNAYDVVYYAGDANAGSKAIAVNLPNDERVQLSKGTRRLQLKNAMRAKFDEILLPIADHLIDSEQRPAIGFDAFFENVMFHEVAHGLGIKNTIDGSGTVRAALKERASALEEAKADVLGLFMITQLAASGELPEHEIGNNYVTFLASILRSIRFGGASAHGRANLMQLNFLAEAGAFTYDPETERYRVELAAMEAAVDELARRILVFQGDGDYDGLGEFMKTYGAIDATLEANLDRLSAAGIPVDIVFEQGVEVLGL